MVIATLHAAALLVGTNLLVGMPPDENQAALGNPCVWVPMAPASYLGGSSYAMAVFDDGTGPALYAGGTFTSAGSIGGSPNSIPVNFIAKWDGTQWSPLGSGFDHWVTSLLVHDDGSGPALYAGGLFTQANEQPAMGIARWDGKTWSPVGTGFPATQPFVGALATFDAGLGPELYATGSLCLPGEGPGREICGIGVAKWDGATWTEVGSPNGLPAGEGLTLAVWDRSTEVALYAGGTFTSLPLGNAFLAKWDGQTWTPYYSVFMSSVWGLAPYGPDPLDDPQLFAGGQWGIAGGVSAFHVASWDGVSWSDLANTLFGSAFTNSLVRSMAPYAESATVRALYVNSAAPLFGLTAGPAPSASPPVSMGSLAGVDMSQERIGRWDGQAWSKLDEGINGDVFASVVFDDGDGPALFVGGFFQVAGEYFSLNFAKYQCAEAPGSNLGVTLTNGVSLQRPGGSSSYTAVIANHGTDADPALWVRSTIPAGLDCSYTSSATGGASGHGAGVGPLATHLNLPAGSSVTYHLNCQVAQSASGSLPVSFHLRPSIYDANPSDDRATDRDTVAPILEVPSLLEAPQGIPIAVPVALTTVAGQELSGITFSLDYDATCLDPDQNDDLVLDLFTTSLPADFTVTAQFDPLDTDGEIDISIVDAVPPLAALPAGFVAQVGFRVCTAPGPAVDAPLAFSTAPPAAFFDDLGQPVPGLTLGGVVRSLPTLFGDNFETGATDRWTSDFP